MSVTKLFCLKKDGLFVSWDGKTMVEKPHEGIRVSRIAAQRKYRGFEMIPFPEAYDRWYAGRKAEKEAAR